MCAVCMCVCSYDLIFSNSLLMYMSDTEVHNLFTKALSWLRPGGFMFFRETCFKAHGTLRHCTPVWLVLLIAAAISYASTSAASSASLPQWCSCQDSGFVLETSRDSVLMYQSWCWDAPLPSARQHPSYGDCLEVKREYYQNSSVLDCVTQCSQSTVRLCEQFLQVKQIGFVTLGPLRCA